MAMNEVTIYDEFDGTLTLGVGDDGRLYIVECTYEHDRDKNTPVKTRGDASDVLLGLLQDARRRRRSE